MKYTHILWDWNGTLVDDVGCAVECVNDTLSGYGLPKTTVEEYLRVIRPSLDEYYGKIIDLEKHSMLEILQSFQDGYAKRLDSLHLMAGAVTALEFCKSCNAHQFVVSSFEHNTLSAHVKHFKIDSFFEEISGAGDILCGSKTDRAKRIVNMTDKGKAVFIGDSISDYLTAKGAGCDCILIAKGHQLKKDLLECKETNGLRVTVIDNILSLPQIL